MATGQPTQRRLGGGFGGAELGAGAKPGTGLNPLHGGQGPKLLAQLCGTGDDQGFDLIRGLTSGFDSTGSCQTKRPDRLDPTVAQLRHDRGSTRQRRPSSRISVQRIRLAVGTPRPSIRAVDLDDEYPCLPEMPSQRGTEAAGHPETDSIQLAVAVQPLHEGAIAGGNSRSPSWRPR